MPAKRRTKKTPTKPLRTQPARGCGAPKRFEFDEPKELSARQQAKAAEAAKKRKEAAAARKRQARAAARRKGGKKKGRKDPNKPKGALSAFMYFCKDERPKVKKANPDASFAEVAKLLGKRWKRCKNKSKYEALAAKDKKRYGREMKAYNKKK